MAKRTRLSLLALPLLLHAAPAQTYIVDVNNGPGANFTSIDAAVAAVPEGATLFVRAGIYGAFEIVAKSLTVIGEPGVQVQSNAAPSIRIADLASDQFATLRFVSWTQVFYPGMLECADCAGTILLDTCIVDNTVYYFGGAMAAHSCDRIFVRDCRIKPVQLAFPTVLADQSNLTFTGCRLNSPMVVIGQTGGRVHVSNSRLEHNGLGAVGLVEMNGGELVLSGNTVINGSTLPTIPPIPAVHGTGTAVVDPNTNFLSVAPQPYSAGITVISRAVPRLDAATQLRGGAANATLFVPSGGTGALCFGFAAAPHFVGTIPDALWLQPDFALQAIAGAPSVVGSYAVPNASYVLGIQITWQGAVIDPAGSISLSNPNAYVHF